MTEIDAPQHAIKTVMKAFDVLQLIEKLDEPTFTDISEHSEMAESSLYNYLITLEHIGYLTKRGDIYRLSLRFFDHGVLVRDQLQIVSHARDILKKTAEESGSSAWISVEEHGKMVYVAREVGELPIETHARLGKHDHMHCLAGGKAILAHLPEERVHEIIDEHGLPAKTPYSITSRESLVEELEEIRKQGYATNNRERAEGAWAVAAPIIVNDVVQGAIATWQPSARIKSEEHRQKIIELITSASNQIELRMTFD
ncbi:DNA-binding transcriptional regulator, IclR family [Halopenitus malekzadehii]|uniref:DNA-binding transcriptional regulator, IclR family n=1 Tax=Halopenitus malekzadehii TaxID=1267564 RepID=A0A1H6K0A8_9EURY|nr:IclR family transcriptional regulator [Halopenitus malekzadehii]SEH65700.1 DNA-binding transcriptional regulator, IclR family [Halopenitus malekzadehii]